MATLGDRSCDAYPGASEHSFCPRGRCGFDRQPRRNRPGRWPTWLVSQRGRRANDVRAAGRGLSGSLPMQKDHFPGLPRATTRATPRDPRHGPVRAAAGRASIEGVGEVPPAVPSPVTRSRSARGPPDDVPSCTLQSRGQDDCASAPPPRWEPVVIRRRRRSAPGRPPAHGSAGSDCTNRAGEYSARAARTAGPREEPARTRHPARLTKARERLFGSPATWSPSSASLRITSGPAVCRRRCSAPSAPAQGCAPKPVGCPCPRDPLILGPPGDRCRIAPNPLEKRHCWRILVTVRGCGPQIAVPSRLGVRY